jgi:hypothetical protein
MSKETRTLRALLLAAALCCFAAPAPAQSIDVAAAAAGTQWWTWAHPGTTLTVYILARPYSVLASGISGAELRVRGLPAGWQADVIPNPASFIALGNPFATAPPFRANIAFDPCIQADANDVILLYTVSLTVTSQVTEACLWVEVADPPTNAEYLTPILTACDPPEYTAHPAMGGYLILTVTWLQDGRRRSPRGAPPYAK